MHSSRPLWLALSTSALLLDVPRQPARQPSAQALAALQRRIATLAKESRGQLGVAAMLLEGGDSVIVNARYRHPMQSVYKLPIAMALLQQVDRRAIRLDRLVDVPVSEYVTPGQRSPLRDENPRGARVTVAELVRLAVAESDGTASDVLLRLLGGKARAERALRGMGIRNLMIASTELEIGTDHRAQYRSWTTPGAAVSVLRALYLTPALSDSSRARLVRHMTETTTGPDRLRAGIPRTLSLAHKTGSSGTRSGMAAATNDIGVVTLPDGRHLAIAVLLSDSRALDSTRVRVIADVARAAYAAWTNSTPAR